MERSRTGKGGGREVGREGVRALKYRKEKCDEKKMEIWMGEYVCMYVQSSGILTRLSLTLTLIAGRVYQALPNQNTDFLSFALSFVLSSSLSLFLSFFLSFH